MNGMKQNGMRWNNHTVLKITSSDILQLGILHINKPLRQYYKQNRQRPLNGASIHTELVNWLGSPLAAPSLVSVK